jgi:DUF917 family protein
MGSVYPELQTVTFTMHDVSTTPSETTPKGTIAGGDRRSSSPQK